MGYRTVLAYSNPGYSRRVLQVSNPDVLYKGQSGVLLLTDININMLYVCTDYPTGVREEANNARVITENRFLMADIGDESEHC